MPRYTIFSSNPAQHGQRRPFYRYFTNALLLFLEDQEKPPAFLRGLPCALLVTMIVATMGTACSTTRVFDFTAISTKNMQLRGETGSRVTGESCSYYIFGIPWGSADVKSAIDSAIESAGPQYDSLQDGVININYFLWTLPYYVSACWEVTGTAMSTKGYGSSSAPSPASAPPPTPAPVVPAESVDQAPLDFELSPQPKAVEPSKPKPKPPARKK